MSIYIVRACRAKPGQGDKVRDILKKAIADLPGTFVYQSLGDPHDYGVFMEFGDENAARRYANTHEKPVEELTSLVEGATGISVWKRV